ncbi:MAG: hypothetical protein LBK45_06395 [Tannerellaceae bacterium]|jgi:hypothetical protein|nr:hypothetical protein [Tannerellaceae bacterium]
METKKEAVDTSAETRWEKSNKSYLNYLNYLDKKKDRFDLTFIDLLYISNFKGGNATIHEEEDDINRKLKSYTEKLREMNTLYGGKSLRDLTDSEINTLIDKIKEVCDLTKKEGDTNIDGFSVSYLSALLNAYFPDLIPIIDRRVLINLGLVKEKDIDSTVHIKNIYAHYGELIREFARLMKDDKRSMREIDRSFFILKLNVV